MVAVAWRSSEDSAARRVCGAPPVAAEPGGEHVEASISEPSAVTFLLYVLDVVRGDVEWWREASCGGVESELTLSVAATALLLAMDEALSKSVTLALWPRKQRNRARHGHVLCRTAELARGRGKTFSAKTSTVVRRTRR